MEEARIVTACNQIYAETNHIYSQYRQQLGTNDLGFKILYGPPHLNAPVLFIGDQPGGTAAEDFKSERYEWFPKCEYATESWPLARNMQNMFGPTFLLGCVGVNANFFRAQNSSSWNSVPRSLRDTLERFCSEQLFKLISLLNPIQIVVIGFSTLDKFCSSQPLLYGAKDRVLMRAGKVGQRPAVSTLHLSGAHIATDDRRKIAKAIRDIVGHGTASGPTA